MADTDGFVRNAISPRAQTVLAIYPGAECRTPLDSIPGGNASPTDDGTAIHDLCAAIMKPKLKFLLALVATALLSACLHSLEGADKYGGHCDVVFDGESTLDTFTGNITNVPLEVICGTNNAGEALLNSHIEIGPRQLTTHNAKRDAKMYQMFKPSQFPKLIVAVSNAPLAAARLAPAGLNSDPGMLPMQVTICGITNNVSAKTFNPVLVAEGWEFDLDADLSLKSFKLKPPTLLLGAISVRDTVKVKAHVKLQKEPP
jgi:YceI-like domain